MDSLSIAAWTNYLAVQTEVAATLTGLVFVAVSINLSRVLSTPGLTGRAAESMVQLFGVVLVSTSVLIPAQPHIVMGSEVLALGAGLWLFETVLQVRYLRSNPGHPRAWGITRIIQTQFANLPFCISGVLLLRDSPAGLYWLAPGCVFSLISGVASAWVLLIEILR